MKAVVNEKDLEIRMLKTKLAATGEIVRGFASALSEKISSLVTDVCDSPDLESTSKKLERVRNNFKI